jgi:hypothetical protein
MLNIGDYITTQWINGRFVRNWLRRIDHETPTQFVSRVQHTLICDEKEEAKAQKILFTADSVYSRFTSADQRFRKDGKGFVKPITTRRTNTDGNMTLNKVNSFAKDLQSTKTYDELFKADVRQIWVEKDSNLRRFNFRQKMAKRGDRTFLPKDWFLDSVTYESKPSWEFMGNVNINDTHLYLENLFPNRQIFELSDFSLERQSETSDLLKNAYFHQITTYGGDTKYKKSKDAFKNGTIIFWVFEDRVVYADMCGIDTW